MFVLPRSTALAFSSLLITSASPDGTLSLNSSLAAVVANARSVDGVF
jgi:hypothetical protein